MTIDREKIRRDAERIVDLVWDDHVGIVWGDGDEERAQDLAVSCLALLAEHEQAERERKDYRFVIQRLIHEGGTHNAIEAGKAVLAAWDKNGR